MARFEPRRAGIIGLWDYADEEFVFADGWLVLRGPNGSGKTKALESLFPFLLDGNISPRRLNPFASTDRTMKSNLLFRGKENGLGYVWMEFCDGERYTTIGIGLRANKHQDTPKRWHFVVEGRVGVDFGLIAADDRVCNRKELIEQFPEGAVTDQPREYRERVNAALFGLEAERYEQMLELILTLRRPQLAKELDPETLSETLSAGLRPIDEKLVADAAKSFEDMEEVARALASLRSADELVARFLTLYGTYARAKAKLAVDAVDARLEAVQGSLQEETTAAAAAKDAHDRFSERSEAAEAAAERVGELDGTLQGLKDSDAYRDRLEVEDLRKTVAQAESQMRTLAAQSADRRGDLDEAETETGRLAEAAAEAESKAERLTASAAACAERAGADWTFSAETDRLRRHTAAAVEQRRDALRRVERAAASSDAADGRRGRAEAAAEKAGEAHLAASRAVASAHEAVNAERARWEGRLRDWAVAAAAALGVDLAADTADWVAEADAETAPLLRERASDRSRPFKESIERRRHEHSVRLAGIEQQVERKRAELEKVRGEHDDAPASPHWRDASRADRAGTPLWRSVRFKPEVDDVDAASLEAALEAAGLLDAWIGETADADDSALRALPESDRPTGTVLADYLECEDDADAASLAPVLASIAVSANSGATAYSVVGLNGRFAHGALAGRARKPSPEFIGATARQRRREQRILELEAELDALGGETDDVSDAVAECETAIRALDDALRAMPAASALVAAFGHVASRELVAAERAGDLASAASELDQAVAGQLAAARHLFETESACALARGDIETVRGALVDFESAVRELLFALKTRIDLDDQVERQQARTAKIARSAADVAATAAAAEDSWRSQRSRLDSIEQSLDADTAAVFERIEAVEREIKQAGLALEDAAKRREEAMKDEVRAEDAVKAAAERTLAAIGEARSASVELRPFCDDDLLTVLECRAGHRWPETEAVHGPAVLPGAVTGLLDDLRAATMRVQASENSAKGATTSVNKALQEIMAQLPATGLDHHVRWDSPFGVITAEVDTDEGRRAIGHYGDWLHRQREEQEQLLTEREQHVLEDALLTSLTGQIHQRVLESKDLVEQMDIAMRERRTSSGMRLTVSWRLDEDLPQAERDLFALFDGAPARLSTKMGEIRRYFADRIKQERARSKAETTYRELLADVLDYRGWRKFKFTLLRAGGTRQDLTKKAHSALSGGEQSVTLHLPLFAAANAVFGSAEAHAPRMIGLDEAFAGVDEKGRGELMHLAARFDLQLVMTGYDLWATYPEVRGAAHYSLSHDEATGVVSPLLMVWNGAERTETHDFDGSLAAALGSPGTRKVPPRE